MKWNFCWGDFKVKKMLLTSTMKEWSIAWICLARGECMGNFSPDCSTTCKDEPVLDITDSAISSKLEKKLPKNRHQLWITVFIFCLCSGLGDTFILFVIKLTFEFITAQRGVSFVKILGKKKVKICDTDRTQRIKMKKQMKIKKHVT